jgi:uncharacterized phage protein (TIGR01671 family)
MNREILFRAKNTVDGRWVYGNLILYKGHREDFTTAIQVLDSKKEVLYVACVDPKTVGQFTNVHDCKGRKIFEGDICRDDLADTSTVVEFKFGAWSWQYYEDPEAHWEVIGNIHD